MKKITIITIITLGLLYVIKVIVIANSLNERIQMTLDPNDYINSIFYLFKRGEYTDLLIVFISIVGLLIRKKIGFVLSLLYPLYVFVYFLINDKAFSDFLGHLLYGTVILVILLLPVSRTYFNLTDK